ncbi:MAG: hypothetical protein RIE59_03355 [Imperialibacter sp.]
MKWIVIEENPKPDDYIAIMVANEVDQLHIEEKAYSVFGTGEEAISRSMLLKQKFGTKTTRIFHWEGHSVAFPKTKTERPDQSQQRLQS